MCVCTFDNVSLHVADAFFFFCSQLFERKKAEEDPVNHISNAVHSLLRYSLSLYIFLHTFCVVFFFLFVFFVFVFCVFRSMFPFGYYMSDTFISLSPVGGTVISWTMVDLISLYQNNYKKNNMILLIFLLNSSF